MSEFIQEPESDADWWRNAVVYQIYPRSFADSNGDGEGDLPGVTSRIPYLKKLGVDAVWLSPFYPSALADGGYDVDDYRDVAPRHGTMNDFDVMAHALHDNDIKVIVDIVPNHTSNRHEWFKAALAGGRGAEERNRYIFRDGSGLHGESPPNDWESVFGGPAWEPVGDGTWYLHNFAPEQPDLNWDNHHVREDFRKTIRFWADHGADGFRVDVAHGLVHDLTEPYARWETISDFREVPDGTHPMWDRDAVHEIYADWRRIFNEYDPPLFAVAEAHSHPTRRQRYASLEGLGQTFNFEMQDANWDVKEYRHVIDFSLEEVRLSGSATTWTLGCHDVPRVASRYGLPVHQGKCAIAVARDWLLSDGRVPELDRKLGERRARAAAMIGLALPYSHYIYQGDELGLHEVAELRRDELQDPMAFTSPEKGRDGCRVPLPWNILDPSFGFGSAPGWLRQPEWFADYAAYEEAQDPDSTLWLYRRALAERKLMLPTVGESFEWVDSAPEVLHFRRGDHWQSVTNFGEDPVELPEGRLALSSIRLPRDRYLPQDATAWVVTI